MNHRRMTFGAALLAAGLLGASPEDVPADDSGFMPFVGSWSCQSTLGFAAKMQYSADTSGATHLLVAWKNGTSHGTYDHTFKPVADTYDWTTTNTGSDGSVFNGQSSGFNGNSIQFEGFTRIANQVTPTRETLTLVSHDRSQHEYERRDGDEWRQYRMVTCTRDAAAPAQLRR